MPIDFLFSVSFLQAKTSQIEEKRKQLFCYSLQKSSENQSITKKFLLRPAGARAVWAAKQTFSVGRAEILPAWLARQYTKGGHVTQRPGRALFYSRQLQLSSSAVQHCALEFFEKFGSTVRKTLQEPKLKP